MATNFADPDCNMGPGCILWIICGWGQIVWDRRLNQGQGDPSKRCQSASIVHPSASLRLPSQSLCVTSADVRTEKISQDETFSQRSDWLSDGAHDTFSQRLNDVNKLKTSLHFIVLFQCGFYPVFRILIVR